MNVQFLSVLVRTFSNLQTEIFSSVQQFINVAYLAMNIDHPLQWKDRVLVRIGN